MSLWPTEVDARAFADARALTTWAGLSFEAHEAIQVCTGDWQDHVRNLALLPGSVIAAACGAARVPTATGGERQLSPVECAQVGLSWRLARKILAPVWEDYVDEDPLAPPPPVAPLPTVVTVAAPIPQPQVGRKVCFKSVLDQSDDTEVVVADESRMVVWAANWEKFAQGPPLEEEEPTVEQLTALDHRVVTLGGSPYADFSVFTPYNRRVSRANKFVAHLPQADGSWLSKEIPGPQNFHVWGYCWNTFRCCAIMLAILKEAALMAYFRTISGLVGEWPDCWSLIYLAEDKGRSEILPRKRRAFEASIAAGNPAPPLWDTASPWSACLLALANDDAYWNRNVRNLCVSWLTRGRHLLKDQAILGRSEPDL